MASIKKYGNCIKVINDFLQTRKKAIPKINSQKQKSLLYAIFRLVYLIHTVLTNLDKYLPLKVHRHFLYPGFVPTYFPFSNVLFMFFLLLLRKAFVCCLVSVTMAKILKALQNGKDWTTSSFESSSLVLSSRFVVVFLFVGSCCYCCCC